MTGEQLRDQGIERVASKDNGWLAKARSAVSLFTKTGQTFTAEDVRKLAGEPPHPNLMGVALREFSRCGRIEVVGMAKPARSSRHANRNPVWKVKEAA